MFVYGEGQANDKVHNLRGQLYQHKDGGGLQQINKYDFKGNTLDIQQQLLNNATLTDVDWDSAPVLSIEVFTSAVTYDALNRPVTQTDPGSNVTAFTYEKGGYLKTVVLNSVVYVQDIHYDAKGQRQAIWYGNNTKTSYTYDTETFRLRRLLTVNLGTNDQLQDLNYYYDPVGNITTIRDDAQQTLFFNNTVVSPTQTFTYDALYRLIEAQGRELIGTASFGSGDNWNDTDWKTSHKGNGNAVQAYSQQYTYDEVGNITQLQHIANTGSYTRTYDIDTNSNRLISTFVTPTTYNYYYDGRGNMTAMPHLSALNWNLQNELNSTIQGGNTTCYQYSNGQRIRKYTDKGTIKEERIYFGSFELYRKFDSIGSLKIERQTVHVSDNSGRIAMLEKRTYGNAADDNNTAATLKRYIYSNHIQSASLELDENAAIISYEEYHPYGTTSYQAMNALINAVAKRYRYTGKERDEESGLYYHGARYYIPWLARWTAVDPLESKYAGLSPYIYGNCNPVIFGDPSGMEGEEFGILVMYNQKPVQYRADAQGNQWGYGFNPETNEFDISLGGIAQPLNEVVVTPLGPGNDIGLYISPIETRDDVLRYYGDRAAIDLQIKMAAEANKAQVMQERISQSAYLDQRFIGESRGGSFYNISRREIAQVEYERNEAWGAAVRGGPLAALGSLLGGREGAMKGAVVDNVMMSFAGVGTPYGKVEPSGMVEAKNIAYTEVSVNSTAGATTTAGMGMATVGRWMSKGEYIAMKSSTTVLEGAGGQTFVTQGGSHLFSGAAKGSVYVEFQVPANSLLQGGKQGWFKMLGPNASKSQQYLLQKQGGSLLPQYQNLSPILKIK